MQHGGMGGGGVPRVQLPGGQGGGMPGGGGGMPPGAGGQSPSGPLPPELAGKIDPTNEMQMTLLQRADSLTEQEGAAILEALMSRPGAAQAMMKLLPELGFIIEGAMGSAGGGQGGGMPPPGGMPAGAGGGAPPPPQMAGGMPGGGMPGGGGAPGGPPGASRLSRI